MNNMRLCHDEKAKMTTKTWVFLWTVRPFCLSCPLEGSCQRSLVGDLVSNQKSFRANSANVCQSLHFFVLNCAIKCLLDDATFFFWYPFFLKNSLCAHNWIFWVVLSLHFFIGSLGSSPLKDHTLKIMLDKTEPMILTLLYKTFYYCHSGGGTNAILSGIKGENSEHECGRCNKDN